MRFHQAFIKEKIDMSLLNIVVLYGGKSTEHEVSVHSAQTVCRLLEQKKDKYRIYPVFISKEGYWFLQKACGFLTPQDQPLTPVLNPEATLVTADGSLRLKTDVVFPVLHGTNCEDGTMQGFLDILNVPYVGCGVLASAMGMDKEISKLMAQKTGAPVLPYRVISKFKKYDKSNLEKWVLQTGLPVFVKPVRLGSSVGVRKVKEIAQLHEAVEFALRFDTDVMVEKGVDRAREIFCAIYGNEEILKSSACGELRSLAGEFFDYEAKYVTAGGCETKVPADIPLQTAQKMRQDSENIFRALRGSGLARVDFLMDQNGAYYFSEINTLPGMSETSLFPQLFEACGEDYGLILEQLIEFARKRFIQKEKLALSR